MVLENKLPVADGERSLSLMVEKGGNLPLIKQKNLSLIKKVIYRSSPISRIEIAQRLSLTSPTITTSVNPMIAQGLLRELPAPREGQDAERAPGRRPVMLEFVPEAYYFCGVDLGPYQICYTLTDLTGRPASTHVSPYAGMGSYESTLDMLAEGIPRFIEAAGLQREKVLGVGVVMPGLIDGTTGKINSTFRSGWGGHFLPRDLSERIGIQVRADNNVRARIIEADLFDRTLLGDPVAYFYVSYGVACHLMIDGNVLYGSYAAAGEIGHTVVAPEGPLCTTCGNFGCLESLASEKAVLDQCRASLYYSRTPSILTELCRSPEALTIEHVLEAQRRGERTVEHILFGCIKYLGAALANMINLISPGTVLIDGHIFSLEQNRARLVEEVKNHTLITNREQARFTFLPYDVYRGARGGASIAVKAFFLEDAL